MALSQESSQSTVVEPFMLDHRHVALDDLCCSPCTVHISAVDADDVRVYGKCGAPCGICFDANGSHSGPHICGMTHFAATYQDDPRGICPKPCIILSYDWQNTAVGCHSPCIRPVGHTGPCFCRNRHPRPQVGQPLPSIGRGMSFLPSTSPPAEFLHLG